MNGFLTYDFIESLKNQKDFKPYIIGLDVENRTKDKYFAINSTKFQIQTMKKIILTTL